MPDLIPGAGQQGKRGSDSLTALQLYSLTNTPVIDCEHVPPPTLRFGDLAGYAHMRARDLGSRYSGYLLTHIDVSWRSNQNCGQLVAAFCHTHLMVLSTSISPRTVHGQTGFKELLHQAAASHGSQIDRATPFPAISSQPVIRVCRV